MTDNEASEKQLCVAADIDNDMPYKILLRIALCSQVMIQFGKEVMRCVALGSPILAAWLDEQN
jgi:hypothetical protein